MAGLIKNPTQETPPRLVDPKTIYKDKQDEAYQIEDIDNQIKELERRRSNPDDTLNELLQNNYFRNPNDIEGNKQWITNYYLPRQIEGLNKQRADLEKRKQEGYVPWQLGRLKLREEELKGELSSVKDEMTSAIDRQLGTMMNELGIGYNQALGQANQAIAQQGIGRSSFGQNIQSELAAKKLQAQAGLREQAAQQKGELGFQTEATQREIENRRKQLAQQVSLGEIKTSDQVQFNLDYAGLQRQWENDLANIKLNAQDQEFFNQLIGGLGQSLATAGIMALMV